MGIFSDILIDIEEMWSNGKPSDAIAEANHHTVTHALNQSPQQ